MMTTTAYTMSDVAAAAQAELGHFAAELAVPVIGLLQAQGDLYVIPAGDDVTDWVPAAADLLPAAGVTLVTGRGGHAHCLAGEGPVYWTSEPVGGQTLGTLTIPLGSVAFVFHATETAPRRLAEHRANGIAPGIYVIRRQREQADEIRLVTD
jgi:hypothetical protein